MKIAELRAEMGLTLEEFAARVGQKSRGRMSVIEAENRCSLPVALAIEELSGCRIDAAELCEDVRRARSGLCVDHAAADSDAAGADDTGKPRESSRAPGQDAQERAA